MTSKIDYVTVLPYPRSDSRLPYASGASACTRPATCDPSPADAKIDVDFANVADKANAPDVLSTFRSGQLVGGDVSDRESVVNGGDVDEGPVDEKKTEEAVLHKQVREA